MASILVAVIGTLLMALYAKMPFAQACGMGLNSFFFVCFILPALVSGADVVAGYQSGLALILVSGLVFLVFSITGLRSKVARALPDYHVISSKKEAVFKHRFLFCPNQSYCFFMVHKV